MGWPGAFWGPQSLPPTLLPAKRRRPIIALARQLDKPKREIIISPRELEQTRTRQVKQLRLDAIATALFWLCLPVFLVTSNVRYVVNEPRLYDYGFLKFNATTQTGIPLEELQKVARAMIQYFNSTEEAFQPEVTTSSGERLLLFNPREVDHLKDVKGLIQGVYFFQLVSLSYLTAYGLLSLFLTRRSEKLARAFLMGGGATLALLVLLGLGVLLAFKQLFWLFHLLGFRNLLWILDPARDNLIRLFPEGFFQDMTLILVGATLIEALLLIGASCAFLVKGKAKAKN